MPMMLCTVEVPNDPKCTKYAAIKNATERFKEKFPEEVPVPVSCRLLEATKDFARFLVTVL